MFESLESRVLLSHGPTYLLDGISDVTKEVTITLSGAPTVDPTTIDPLTSTAEFEQTVQVVNTSTAAIPEPLTLQLQKLTAGVTLDEAFRNSVFTSNALKTFGGSPYVPIVDLGGTSLAPGGVVTVVLHFVDPSATPISYQPHVLSTDVTKTGALQYAINGVPVVVNDVNPLDLGITSPPGKVLTITNTSNSRATVANTFSIPSGPFALDFILQSLSSRAMTLVNPGGNQSIVELAAAGSTNSNVIPLVLKPGKSVQLGVNIGVTGPIGGSGGSAQGGSFPVVGVDPAGPEEQVTTPSGAQQVTIKGDITPAPTCNFGSVAAKRGLDRVFTITNSGINTLVLTADGQGNIVEATGSFAIVAQPATKTLAPGHSTTFTVELKASHTGTKRGTFSFLSNAAPEDQGDTDVSTTSQNGQTPFLCNMSGTVTAKKASASVVEADVMVLPSFGGSLFSTSPEVSSAPWADGKSGIDW